MLLTKIRRCYVTANKKNNHNKNDNHNDKNKNNLIGNKCFYSS